LAPRTELKQLPNGENIKLPFTFMTNNGGFIEERKALELNAKLKLSEEDPIYKITT
jgi:ribonucleotide monophosphatase NagD (HAD superfamily)